ncbi:flagellar motor switch protein FliG [Mesorhizobium sp. NBSH29]|uniref:flagellar motor switch protein FliG n=1 Tax=Mesorhizobium sp. NBSH29 TaxID=2654249 RepID=UPI0018966DF5|nr:flagellar motor switch protein FliG [Mesorhizobium sp. NBSH29]QPC85377.1 flagellar motor switch protein FliG [Mesorhizobium sp. NBSH29]
MSQIATLTRPQKAAAILVAMGKPAASRLLKFFKQEELKALIEGARLLRTIPQGDLEKIVAEFEAEFTEGAGLLDSADKMDTILNESLSPEEMSALMGTDVAASKVEGPLPVWPQLETLDPARLGAFLIGEHPQIAAMVLAKLSPSTSAAVLVTLDKPLRGDIIKRMMTMTTIPDAAVRIIENQIRSRVLVETGAKDISVGQARVANVLNELDKSQLDEVMRDLEEAGTGDLEGVRARLFAFEDIEILTQKARIALLDGISTEIVTLALRGAPNGLAECILSAISQRSRRMVESELGSGGAEIAQEDIMRARKSIASTAIKLADEGSIQLPTAQDVAA